MEGCGGDSSGAGGAGRAVSRRKPSEKPYKGIRMRKWGKWVAEIREPNKRSRIWLGSYSTPVAAARAYDTAVYYLRGPSAKLNFPNEISPGPALHDLSAASIRQKAVEVGSRVDALHTTNRTASLPPAAAATGATMSSDDHESMKSSWFQEEIDLNKKPEPEAEADCPNSGYC